MPPISLTPLTDTEAPENDAPLNLPVSGLDEPNSVSPAHSQPTLTGLDGGYAGLPQRPVEAPVALEQMAPVVLNKTNVPLMLQGGVFVLLPLFFANNPALFLANRMFIWILFALGCGLIASQVPGVDNLNLPKIKLFGLEFAARGWVAVSIIVVMALVNPTKPLLDVVSSAINNNKPVVSSSVNVTPDAKTGELKEVDGSGVAADAEAPASPQKPLTIASALPSSEVSKSPVAKEALPNPIAMNGFASIASNLASKLAVTSAAVPASSPPLTDSAVGVSASAPLNKDVTSLDKISYRDRIILPTVQWQAMGIQLKSGDILNINNVRGTWTLSDAGHDNAPYVDANGGAIALASVKGKPATADSFIMPSAPAAALIGKIGMMGQPFVVGKRLASFPVVETGELYLSINDGSTLGTPGFWDNAGQMQANINVLTAANLE